MSTIRINEYKSMWVLVFFDLPTETKIQRKAYATFRKGLLTDGFSMFQYSIYVRSCASIENSQVHVKRVKAMLPKEGSVCIMTITDRQFKDIHVYDGVHPSKTRTDAIQLELF